MTTSKFNKGENILLILIITMFITTLPFSWSFTQGPNNRNVSIDTTVNITGSAPFPVLILMQSPITLGAGDSNNIITCNATVRDYNGFADIYGVNATLFRSSVGEYAADNNNSHYTNASCAVIAGQQSGTIANYSCTFALTYYALNGTWNCSVRANDSINLRGFNTNTTTINALFALNVTTLIDYGNLTGAQYSENQTANITNLGNININVSVLGYGSTIGDNLSFVCDQGTLSANLQHYSANSTADYATKKNLTGGYQSIPGLTINKTSNTSFSFNTTYWELYVDPTQNAFGRCNGTIIFQAENSVI